MNQLIILNIFLILKNSLMKKQNYKSMKDTISIKQVLILHQAKQNKTKQNKR